MSGTTPEVLLAVAVELSQFGPAIAPPAHTNHPAAANHPAADHPAAAADHPAADHPVADY
jgi:hypothetical protein